MPPLRERRNDIPLLVNHFLNEASEQYGRKQARVSAETLAVLMDYDWPGNVRELQNVIHRAVVLAPGTTIDTDQLPAGIRERIEQFALHVPRTSDELKRIRKELRERSVETVERRFVFDALKRSDWNVTHAASDVGMQRSNFQALMRKHGVHVPDDLHRSG
jgi:DNA-binding NtrC family response regulator